MTNDDVATPTFLPMEEEDAIISKFVIEAAIINSSVPLSEYAKREFFWKCFTKFQTAVKAEPAQIKEEILLKMKYFDELYGINRTPEEFNQTYRFTQGDNRRFGALFYLQSRRLIKDAVFIVKRENKKRVQMRHLLTAAVLNNIIPRSMISDEFLTEEQQTLIDQIIQEKANFSRI